MTREVYARFPDVDQAEAAVRALRGQCSGIHAFQIKHRARPKNNSGTDMIPASAFALWNTSGDFVADRPAAPAAVIPMGYLEDRPDHSDYDGPAGRSECLLEVVVEREEAGHAEAILHAQHGYEVFQTGADLIR